MARMSWATKARAAAVLEATADKVQNPESNKS
jgi:hypothetical protein